MYVPKPQSLRDKLYFGNIPPVEEVEEPKKEEKKVIKKVKKESK